LAHIAGIELPKNKRLFIGLTYIYGIGRSRAIEICKKANIDEMKKVEDLTPEEEKLFAILSKMNMSWKVLYALRLL